MTAAELRLAGEKARSEWWAAQRAVKLAEARERLAAAKYQAVERERELAELERPASVVIP